MQACCDVIPLSALYIRLWNVAALEKGQAASLISTLENGGGTLCGSVFEGLEGIAVASNDSRIRLWRLPSNVARRDGLQEVEPTPRDKLRTSAEAFKEKPMDSSKSAPLFSGASPHSMVDKVEADLKGWKKDQHDIRKKKKADWEAKQAAFDKKVGVSGDFFMAKSPEPSLPRPTLAGSIDTEPEIDDLGGTGPEPVPGQNVLICGGARRQCGCAVS